MPIPANVAASLVSSGFGMAGGAINAYSQEQMNKRSMKFAREMYERQKMDNLAFWGMQNYYNSPQQQMKRFQDAGLNPHLIYGQGSSGQASPISTPDVQTPQFRSPEWGNALQTTGLTLMNAIYDLDIKQAQHDNLVAQNDVIRQEAALRAAQIESTLTGTEKTRFGLDFEKELRDVSADARREQLRQLKTTTDLSIRKDAREAALASSSLSEAVERMLSMREQRLKSSVERTHLRTQIDNARKDGVIKDLEIELRRMGINPQDPMWSRVVGRILSDLVEGGDLLDVSKNVKSVLPVIDPPTMQDVFFGGSSLNPWNRSRRWR